MGRNASEKKRQGSVTIVCIPCGYVDDKEYVPFNTGKKKKKKKKLALATTTLFKSECKLSGYNVHEKGFEPSPRNRDTDLNRTP